MAHDSYTIGEVHDRFYHFVVYGNGKEIGVAHDFYEARTIGEEWLRRKEKSRLTCPYKVPA